MQKPAGDKRRAEGFEVTQWEGRHVAERPPLTLVPRNPTIIQGNVDPELVNTRRGPIAHTISLQLLCTTVCINKRLFLDPRGKKKHHCGAHSTPTPPC